MGHSKPSGPLLPWGDQHSLNRGWLSLTPLSSELQPLTLTSNIYLLLKYLIVCCGKGQRPLFLSLSVAGSTEQSFRAGKLNICLIDLLSQFVEFCLKLMALGARCQSLIRGKAQAAVTLYTGLHWGSSPFTESLQPSAHWRRMPWDIFLFQLVLMLKSCLSGKILCKHPFTNTHDYLRDLEVRFG